MKLFIFGATGLLGHMLVKYLSSLYTVIPVCRSDLHIQLGFQFEQLSNFMQQRQYNQEEDFIVNALGITNKIQCSNEYMETVNSVFPELLDRISSGKFIQVSTDCVFSGSKVFTECYTETDEIDSKDIYGITKFKGEHGMVIRCSIIGPDKIHKRGLMESVMAETKNDNFDGYVNHYWNGITSLEYAKLIARILRENIFWKGVRHITPPYQLNKYQLCKMIAGSHKKVSAVINENTVNRLLSSHFDFKSVLDIQDISNQLQDLKDFQG